MFLAACASTPERPAVTTGPTGVYKVGNPYQIGDTWYYPREQPDYDETGIASWYGPTFHGRKTANGEVFDAGTMSAAHRTLPMPVNVRVTNLENGRSVVLRVNDRGPFAKGRIIDVSEHAAEVLGFRDKGTARVRVTYLDRADLGPGVKPPSLTPDTIASAVPAAPAGKVVTASLDAVPGASVAPATTMKTLPKPVTTDAPPDTTPQAGDEVTKVPVPAVTNLYVQAGAFSSYDNASRLVARLGNGSGLKISAITRDGKTLYRVRSGPFAQVDQADAALSKLNALGSNDAQIVVDR